MYGEPILFADGGEIAMRRPARMQIVFGMHLEEGRTLRRLESIPIVPGLETYAGARRQRRHRACTRRLRGESVHRCVHETVQALGRSRSSAVSEPMRSPGSF